MELLHGFPFNDVRLQACREKFALVPTDTEHPVDRMPVSTTVPADRDPPFTTVRRTGGLL